MKHRGNENRTGAFNVTQEDIPVPHPREPSMQHKTLSAAASALCNSVSVSLRQVAVPVLDNYECEQRLRRTKLGYDFKLHGGFLCAGGEEGKDACKVRRASCARANGIKNSMFIQLINPEILLAQIRSDGGD